MEAKFYSSTLDKNREENPKNNPEEKVVMLPNS